MNGQNHPQDVPIPSAEGMGGLGDILNKLMAHPEVISYVASAIGTEAPSPPPAPEPSVAADTASAEIPASTAPPPDLKDSLSSLAPLISGLSKGLGSSDKHTGHKEQDRRIALLVALKPFVSKGRCDAIDQMLQFSKLAELLKAIR